MAERAPKKKREQVIVYLDERDRALLEDLARRTGLARTELFRRGLRRLAAELSEGVEPGASLAYLIATAAEDEYPRNVAERHDRYLYGGGYESARKKGGGARPR